MKKLMILVALVAAMGCSSTNVVDLRVDGKRLTVKLPQDVQFPLVIEKEITSEPVEGEAPSAVAPKVTVPEGNAIVLLLNGKTYRQPLPSNPTFPFVVEQISEEEAKKAEEAAAKKAAEKAAEAAKKVVVAGCKLVSGDKSFPVVKGKLYGINDAGEFYQLNEGWFWDDKVSLSQPEEPQEVEAVEEATDIVPLNSIVQQGDGFIRFRTIPEKQKYRRSGGALATAGWFGF